jgi:hypothetical protein
MEFLHPRPPSHCLTYSPSFSLPDQLDQQHSRFPTSSDRLGRPATLLHQLPFDHSARYDPLGRLSFDKHSLARKVLCSSFTPRSFPSSIARGVLSDGTWTTEHPCVHAFLQSPYSRPPLKSRTSAAIYSLAALHVFYSPSHPSYDVFWHPDIKESTAIFVHGVVSTYTYRIRSPDLLGLHPFSFTSVSYETLTHHNDPHDLVGRSRYALAAHRYSEGVRQVPRWKGGRFPPCPDASFSQKAQAGASAAPSTRYQRALRGS